MHFDTDIVMAHAPDFIAFVDPFFWLPSVSAINCSSNVAQA
jgi:hypothetical protein